MVTVTGSRTEGNTHDEKNQMSFWSVVQTESQRENIAAQFLQQAEFKIYLPKTLIRRGARERIMPLFPGYLFVEIVEQWWSVRWTTGVIRLLMVNDQPAKISITMMDTIRKREGSDGLIRLPRKGARGLLNGDRIKILRGSFEGKFAIYQGQSGSQRSRILLDLLGREVQTVIATVDMARAG
jgi:transcriptional antiterminator RfaH